MDGLDPSAGAQGGEAHTQGLGPRLHPRPHHLGGTHPGGPRRHRRQCQAGRAAGTRTVAAAFGYIDAGDDPRRWGADVLVRSAHELIAYLD